MIDIKNIHYKPTLKEISEYIKNPLFDEFCTFMDKEYQALSKIEYSKDSLLKGWNIKFRKAGKGLCVAYPKLNYFTILVVVGRKEKESVESVIQAFSTPIQSLYHNTKEGMNQRWLMIDVKEHNQIYQDALKLIQIRRISK